MRNQHRKAQQLPLFTLITLYIIIFLGSAGFFITIPAYVSLFLTDHSLEFAKSMPIEQRRMLFGTVMSAAPFISMFFTPFIARFADKFSRKTVIAICLVIAAIGFALPIYAIVVSSVIILFVGNMINSLGSASQPIAQAILADNSEGKNKATLMSLVAVVMTAAMSFGPALGSKLSASYGAQAPFYACLLIAIVSVAVYYSFTYSKYGKGREPVLICETIKAQPKGLLNCLFIVFICQFSWSLYFQNIAFIFPQKWNIAVESVFYQYFMMGIGVVMIFSLLLLPRLILKRFSVSSALRVTTALSAIGMLLLAITPTPTSHVLAMIFTATMVALCFPLYITALSDRASDIDQGWAMALSSAMVGLAWTLTGYLTAMMVNVHLLLPTGIAVIGYLAAMVVVPTQNTTTEKKTPSELEAE
ncbi:MFS transporter [Photobacterium leiognathi]|nr:MFS transporter [Photobacterium leiognathi]